MHKRVLSARSIFPVGLLLALWLVAFAGCATHRVARRPDYYRKLPPGIMALQKVTDPREYPDFARGYEQRDSLAEAVDHSINYLSRHPSSRKYFPYMAITHERALAGLRAFRQMLDQCRSADELRARIVSDFDVYRSVGADARHAVLFTAYCQPILDGSLVKTGRFRYPLYQLPPDLVKDEEGLCQGRRTGAGGLEAYYTRRQIDGDAALASRGLELAYVADLFDAYIAQVQGSAIIKLPDGSEFQIGYAGSNGYPYTSIGQWLVKKGRLAPEQLSLQGLRRYFSARPEELEDCLFRNDRYTFFVPADGGPYGSLNQPLTPYRSLATDKSIFPRACIAFVETRLPRADAAGRIVAQSFSSFMLDQDTGGAIRTPGRADIFMGTGPDAVRLAGRMAAEGKLYYIFLKPSVAARGAGREPNIALGVD